MIFAEATEKSALKTGTRTRQRKFELWMILRSRQQWLSSCLFNWL